MSDHQQNQAESVIVCNPKAIAPDKRDDHEALVKAIFSPASVLEIRELANGYGIRLPLETSILYKVIAFVANERLCCPFYTFTLGIGEQFWFELTGTPEVKTYLKTELIAALETGKFPTFGELEVAYTAATEPKGD